MVISKGKGKRILPKTYPKPAFPLTRSSFKTRKAPKLLFCTVTTMLQTTQKDALKLRMKTPSLQAYLRVVIVRKTEVKSALEPPRWF